MKRIERFLMNMPLVLISKNELLRRMLWQKRIKNKLKKYFVIHSKPSCVSTLNQQSKVIWWLWYQGSKNAPEIVKMCLSSVKHYAEIMNYAVIELDEKNLFEYVNLPEKLISKWKSGKIGAANFSDIIRVDLLANRGGYGWIRQYTCQDLLIPNFSIQKCSCIKPLFVMHLLQKLAVGL